MAMPRPETPAQMPMARPRSSGGKTPVRIDSVDGMMSAPPMPMRARVAVRTLAVPAKAEATEPNPKMTRPRARGGAAAEAVGQAPGREQQARKDEDVGIDDP